MTAPEPDAAPPPQERTCGEADMPECPLQLWMESQLSTPPSRPCVTQVSPPSALPSQVSPGSMTPSPHTKHSFVSKPEQSARHVSVPLSKFSDWQLSPSRSVPSHTSSGPAIRLSPHS